MHCLLKTKFEKFPWIYFNNSFFLKDTKQDRIVVLQQFRDFWRSSCPIPSVVNSDQIAEALSNCILIMSINGDSSFSLGNLLQCLIYLIMNLVFFLVFVGVSLAVACIC